MQIWPTSVRLVRLNFGLSLYLDRTFGLSLSLSRNFGLRPKFGLSERLSEITSLFDLSLVLDRTLAQQKAQRKAKSKKEVAHWPNKTASKQLSENWPGARAGPAKKMDLAWTHTEKKLYCQVNATVDNTSHRVRPKNTWKVKCRLQVLSTAGGRWKWQHKKLDGDKWSVVS